jgi:hypothetical protein
VQRPLATVVIGGILSSTFLTLVLIPVLYEWIEGKTRQVVPTPSMILPVESCDAVQDSRRETSQPSNKSASSFNV